MQFDSGVLTKGINQSLAPPLCTSAAEQGLDADLINLITQVLAQKMQAGLFGYDILVGSHGQWKGK